MKTPRIQTGAKWLAALACLVSAGVAHADSPPSTWATSSQSSTIDYKTPRTEIAGFPLISGNSDIGVQFGAVGTMTRFGGDIKPYRWNFDLLLSTAVKPGEGFTQYGVRSNIDIPGLYEGRLRLNPAISFTRTTNLGYFGLGNASSDVVPPGTVDSKRFFQFTLNEVLVRALARIHLDLPFDIVPLLIYRHESPTPYAGSKLAQDAVPPAPGEKPVALGVQPLSLVSIGGGIIFDSRDNEFFPFRGHFHQIGAKFVEGFPFSADIRYGEQSTVLIWFTPIDDNIVWASRAVVDLEFGNVPFYDLFSGGPFKTQYMLGGSAGVRGVPIGRFLGKIKVLANQELRSILWNPHVFGQDFHIGAGAFFDVGRVWLDYTFDAPEDGSFPGLKWGAGIAGYLVWGRAAVFRVDIAGSPFARAISSIPFAFYVEDNLMF
jgi:Omp85 superfamily domain